MGKEQTLLTTILNDPDLPNIRGNPQKVLEKIEHFSANTQWLMIVGPHKGQRVLDKIDTIKPKVMIELGCYVGYSAILFGKELAKTNGKYHSFELSPEFANIAQQLIDIAGLSSTVEIHVGPASDTLPEFAKASGNSIDFAFIDHAKNLYVHDLKILESTGLVTKGTVLAADNILVPGAPEYHEYVNLSPDQKKVLAKTGEYPGKWDLVYESKLLEVDIDAVEISVCVGP